MCFYENTNQKKTLAAAFMAFVMVAAFAGCGEKDNSKPAEESVVPTSSVASTVEESSEVASIASEEESTVQSSAQSQDEESSAQVEDSRSESSVASNEETSNSEASITGQQEDSNIDLTSSESIVENSEDNSVPDVSLSLEELFDSIPNITEDELNAMDSVNEKDVVCYGRIKDGVSFVSRTPDGPFWANSGDLVRIIYKMNSSYVIYITSTHIHYSEFSDIELLPLDYTPGADENIVGK